MAAADAASRQSRLETLQDRLDAFLARVRRETSVPGIAAAISMEGARIGSSVGVVDVERDSPLTGEAEFHLGCITKLLVSIVALELAREEQLDLAVPIQEYLPELRGTVHGATVSLSHLLSHTSGYRGVNIFERDALAMDWRGLVEHLRAAPRHFVPGTVFSYEHTETVVVGEILRRVTRSSSIMHIRERLFEPLGIRPGRLQGGAAAGTRRAGQHVLDPRTGGFKQVRWSDLAMAGGGPSPMWESAFSQHALPLDALLTIAEHVMGQPGRSAEPSPRPCGAATLHLLQRPAVSLVPMTGGPLSETLPATFGLGACRWPDGFYGVAGATYGQCQSLRFDAASGTAVAVGVNALQRYLRDLVIGRICETLAGPETDAAPKARADFDLDAAAGEYHGARNDRATAAVDEGRLVIVLESGASPIRLRAEMAPDGQNGFTLSCPAPELSLGFFRTPEDGELGLMVGTTAYKRVATTA